MISNKIKYSLINKTNHNMISSYKNITQFSSIRYFSKTSNLKNPNTEKLLKFYRENYYKYYNRRYYKYYALGALTSAGIIAYNTSDTMNTSMKYTYRSIKRVYKVTSTLMKCIYNYSVTLSQRSSLPIEEYTSLLNATHKKSAEQTLVTIQENGGIYIKLRPTHICNDLSTSTSMDRYYDSFTTRML